MRNDFSFSKVVPATRISYTLRIDRKEIFWFSDDATFGRNQQKKSFFAALLVNLDTPFELFLFLGYLIKVG